jgi:hypothetical protein
MSNATPPLPERFRDLERFLDWALPTTAARVAKRKASSPAELKEFYAGAIDRMDDVLGYLNEFPLTEIPAGARPLYDIALSLAEIAPYVEWFGGESRSPTTRNSGLELRLVGEPR